MSGAGTQEAPWQLKTPPGTSEYEMYLDERDGRDVIVCVVGKTATTSSPSSTRAASSR